MTKNRFPSLLTALVLPLVMGATGVRHIELVASFPDADQVLDTSPSEIWLKFSVVPDMEQTSFSVRGPEGGVELGDVAIGDSEEVIRADVVAPLGAGVYTVSWVGAPADDHPTRGRYTFTIEAR